MTVPSGLQPSPLETVTPFTTGVSVPPESSRYSPPSGSFSLRSMEPTQTRPAGSTPASLNRTPSLPGGAQRQPVAAGGQDPAADHGEHRGHLAELDGGRLRGLNAGDVQLPAGNVDPEQAVVFRPPVGALAEYRGHIAYRLRGDRHPDVHHGRPTASRRSCFTPTRRLPSRGCARPPSSSRRSRPRAGLPTRWAPSGGARASWRAVPRCPARSRPSGRPRRPPRARWSPRPPGG